MSEISFFFFSFNFFVVVVSLNIMWVVFLLCLHWFSYDMTRSFCDSETTINLST
ncbi:hypothetical protein Sjap_000758 [Stephania japonica]|uniref:Uncharacterized protein n=1 Tax=Stephania japonica TaxID=461633 RepID=A0AAP0PQT8_9MAGN